MGGDPRDVAERPALGTSTRPRRRGESPPETTPSPGGTDGSAAKGRPSPRQPEARIECSFSRARRTSRRAVWASAEGSTPLARCSWGAIGIGVELFVRVRPLSYRTSPVPDGGRSTQRQRPSDRDRFHSMGCGAACDAVPGDGAGGPPVAFAEVAALASNGPHRVECIWSARAIANNRETSVCDG